MDIGTRLRAARERRHLSLRDIAGTTKLSIAVLEHIERNEFDGLPGGLYTRGYLRAYANAVGEDPEAVVREFLTETKPVVEEHPAAPPPDLELTRVPRWQTAAVVGVLLVAGALPLLRGVKAPWQGAPDAIPVSPVPAVVEAAPAVAETSAVAHAGEDPLVLEIQPSDTCWVSVVADGQPVLYKLLARDERVTVSAHTEFVVRVGEPSAFVYSLQGRPGRAIGPAGRPVSVRITDQNYQLFLAPPEAEEAPSAPLAPASALAAAV